MDETPELPVPRAFTAQSGPRLIHGTSVGQGPKTVVLLTGLGAPARWWHELGGDESDVNGLLQNPPWQDRPFLAPSLAPFARVISYDRAGIGESSLPNNPRSLDDFLSELEALLAAAEVASPVVLAGHSLGGVIALAYARRFPARVAGLVLLDSSHPDQVARFATVADAERLTVDAEDRRLMSEEHPERPDLDSLLVQGPLGVGELGELPVIVVSRESLADRARPADVLMEDWRSTQVRDSVWQQLQAELATLSTRARHLPLSGSGHYVHFDRPQETIGAILTLLKQLTG
ncbi:alpha/beta hydrolase [Deinococcus radiomollis]|uniref:alpha/beta fold hydrolase n=1 Tax=Deinococcus radiomollis TaxID=468916 RepID=UPI003891CC7B